MRDPAKLKVNRDNSYRRHRKKLLKAANDRYWEKREDRIKYQRHYRLVQKQLKELERS